MRAPVFCPGASPGPRELGSGGDTAGVTGVYRIKHASRLPWNTAASHWSASTLRNRRPADAGFLQASAL